MNKKKVTTIIIFLALIAITAGAVFLIKELFNLNKRKDSIAKAIKLFLTRKTLIKQRNVLNLMTACLMGVLAII